MSNVSANYDKAVALRERYSSKFSGLDLCIRNSVLEQLISKSFNQREHLFFPLVIDIFGDNLEHGIETAKEVLIDFFEVPAVELCDTHHNPYSLAHVCQFNKR